MNYLNYKVCLIKCGVTIWVKKKNNKKIFYKHAIKATYKELKKSYKEIVNIQLIPKM